MSADTAIPTEGTHFTTVEDWLTTDDGAKLYTKTWTPTGDVKARVVWIHGFSDYCNNTGNFIPGLAQRGIEVCAFDQRGAGYSVHKPKDKGDAGPTSRVLADITHFVQTRPARAAPLFLAGHSMGGGETLFYIAQGDAGVRARVRGYIAVSPLIGLSPKTAPAAWLEAAGRLAVKVLPRFHMTNEIKAEYLTRDAGANAAYRKDPLIHNVGTLEQLQGMLDRGNALRDGSVVVGESLTGREVGSTGLVVMHGTADDVTDCETSRKFVERAQWKDKAFKPFDGFYHVLQREPAEYASQFTKEFADWVLERS